VSICTCTPKQKDSGRYGKRCTAHSGHSTSAYAARKRPAKRGENLMILWAHCVSEHAAILTPQIGLQGLVRFHEHEHEGPGTIRNHPPGSRFYSIRKMGIVLSEAET